MTQGARASQRVLARPGAPRATLALRGGVVGGVVVVVVGALASCGTPHETVPASRPEPVSFEEIPVDLPHGTSDLSLDDRGHLWSIAERDPEIDELVLGGTPPSVSITRHPLEGVPPDVDTEALAWLGDGKFAVGTEGHDAATAAVMSGTMRADGHIELTPWLSFADDQLGVVLRPNHGVEALCGHGDDLLVGIETTGRRDDGTRWAPLVRVHAGAITGVHELRLTTGGGKVSALFCAFHRDGTIDLLAIERHFGVARILKATVVPGVAEVTPTVALDLWPVVRDRFHGKLNLEGIVQLADGRWVLVNDNQGGNLEGPTELFVVQPR